MKDWDCIPAAMRELRRWVCSDEGSKLPFMTAARKPASVSDPSTWDSLENAAGAVRSHIHDSIGYVFTEGDGIVGFDIDAGYDGDGLLTPLAVDLIRTCRSYTERSRSGRGFHIFVRGRLPFSGRSRGGIEAYREGRFFIMTGKVFMYRDLAEGQAAIDYIVDKYFKAEGSDGDPEGVIPNKIYEPVWRPPGMTVPLRPAYPPIPDGCRNICLTSLAGTMLNAGYQKDQILAELDYCNRTACVPPLDKREVRGIVRSVMRYRK